MGWLLGLGAALLSYVCYMRIEAIEKKLKESGALPDDFNSNPLKK